jgi:ribosomal protein S27E
MAIVVNGYVRRAKGNSSSKRPKATHGSSYDWFLVKNCSITLNNINFPPYYNGKKIKLKIEIVDNNEAIRQGIMDKMGRRGICLTCTQKHDCKMASLLKTRYKMLDGNESTEVYNEYYIDDPTFDEFGNTDWCPNFDEISDSLLNKCNDKILKNRGIKLKCYHCKHEWIYGGTSLHYVRCVNCGKNVAIPQVNINYGE